PPAGSARIVARGQRRTSTVPGSARRARFLLSLDPSGSPDGWTPDTCRGGGGDGRRVSRGSGADPPTGPGVGRPGQRRSVAAAAGIATGRPSSAAPLERSVVLLKRAHSRPGGLDRATGALRGPRPDRIGS